MNNWILFSNSQGWAKLPDLKCSSWPYLDFSLPPHLPFRESIICSMPDMRFSLARLFIRDITGTSRKQWNGSDTILNLTLPEEKEDLIKGARVPHWNTMTNPMTRLLKRRNIRTTLYPLVKIKHDWGLWKTPWVWMYRGSTKFCVSAEYAMWARQGGRWVLELMNIIDVFD